MVDGLQREVPGHELDDGLEAGKGRADAGAGKGIFGDRRVDHAPLAELIEQALGDLVGALILADLLAHDEHAVVGAHLLGHGVAQRLTHGHGHHLGAGRNLGLGFGARLGRCNLRSCRRFLDLRRRLAEICVLHGALLRLRHRPDRFGDLRHLREFRASRRALQKPPHPEERPQAAFRRMTR